MVVYASGLQDPEGPAMLPNGDLLVVEMRRERSAVSIIDATTHAVAILARTAGFPQSVCVDGEQGMWVAEGLERTVLRMDRTGGVLARVDRCDGERFWWPNDLAVGPDGAIYVTDSGTDAESFFENGAVCKDFAGRAYDGGVFRISRRSLSVSRVDRGLRFANGIAFDGNGRLYVNETLTGWIYTYNVGKGPPFRREKFANVFDGESQASGPATLHGPDGMKFGSDGRLYCTVYGVGVIAVLDREGAVVDKIQTIGMLPTNIAFDARGYPRAYVTEVEHGCVELLEMPCGGLALYE